METKTIVVEVESNLGSLKSQLREAQAEVSAMAEKFGATSVEAINAAKAAARLKDTIGDAKQLTDAFNPDAKFKALTASMSGALNGFQAVEGAMGLFGAEGKAVQETLLKVQSAMALAQGVDGLLEARDAFKTFGATAINAFKSIAAAVAANPLGLLLTVITLAAGAFVYLQSTAETAAERMSKGFNGVANAIHQSTLNLERQNKIQNTTTETTLKNLDKEARRRVAMGEDSVKVQREINNLKIKTLEIAIEEDKALVRQKKSELEIILTIEAQTKARLMAQITRVKIDMANSTTSIGQAYEAKKLIDLGEQYAKVESDANKTKQESLKLIYSTTAEIIASKDAVANLKISQLELNKAEKDGREAKKDNEEKVTTDFKATSEFDIMNEGDIFAEGLRKKESDRIAAANTEKEAARIAELEGISFVNKVKEEKRIEDEAADKASNEKKLALEKDVRNAKIEMASNALSVIGELANAFAGKSEAQQRKAFNINKAASIAQATISTYQAAQSAYASQMTIPSPDAPIRGAIAAGIAIASGIAKVAVIAKTQFGGGGGQGGGGGGGGDLSAAAPAMPTPANFNVVGNSGTNQLMQGLQNQPIKAYVVG